MRWHLAWAWWSTHPEIQKHFRFFFLQWLLLCLLLTLLYRVYSTWHVNLRQRINEPEPNVSGQSTSNRLNSKSWPLWKAFLVSLTAVSKRYRIYQIPYRQNHLHRGVYTWRSFWGFQSESKMMQVSAAVKLMPSPPALVHSRNTKRSESGLENLSMAACRRLPRTLPSIRSYGYLRSEEVNYDKQVCVSVHKNFNPIVERCQTNCNNLLLSESQHTWLDWRWLTWPWRNADQPFTALSTSTCF